MSAMNECNEILTNGKQVASKNVQVVRQTRQCGGKPLVALDAIEFSVVLKN